jgi:Tfp pilus assembly protein PilN
MSNIEHVNFLPEDYVQRKDRRRTLAAGASLTLAVAAALGLGILRISASLRSAERCHADVMRDYNEAAERFADVCRQHESQQKIIQQAATAAALVDSLPRSNVVAELTNCLPAGASLIDLTVESRPRAQPTPAIATAFDLKKSALKDRQAPEPMALAEGTAADVSVKITGLAETDVQVARYLSQLNGSPLFQDVSLLISESYAPPGRKSAPLRRFQIQMTLKADAKLRPKSARDETLTADSDD